MRLYDFFGGAGQGSLKHITEVSRRAPKEEILQAKRSAER
jgi:hypothetical protein